MASTTPFLRSLTIQCRVIGALLMREIITRYGRHNIGFMWLFVEPMMFTIGIATLWSITKSTHGSNLPIIAFAVTGYSSVLLWRNSSMRASKALEPNLSLLYHRNVRVLDLFASRLLLEVSGATISFMSIMTACIFFDFIEVPVDVMTMIIAWALLAGFAFGLGLVIGALSERSDVIDRIMHPVTYLIFPFSGAAFMVDWLPPKIQEVILWVPMVHGTEMLRHGYFGSLITTYEDPLYLFLTDIILILFGLALARETARRVEQ